MGDKRRLSHDILNAVERIRIMHDLVKDKNFEMISLEEIQKDFDETLKKLKSDFEKLVDVD